LTGSLLKSETCQTSSKRPLLERVGAGHELLSSVITFPLFCANVFQQEMSDAHSLLP
jgi:hypothetical protein